ncbi:Hypothetical predicted protein [Marmota monax]|uniref:Tubulin polymerization-promoting protein n=1 Tax=Marmota monax TaxID=9995 RepID=A0A5E4C6J9_MARMO|nr:Hypothetical predicted protein [Marmota monax]
MGIKASQVGYDTEETDAWAMRTEVEALGESRRRRAAVAASPSNMADSKAKPAKAANRTPPKSPGDPARDKATKRLSLESEGASEGAAAAPELSALEEAFRRFAVHGDTRATGKEMHGKNWSKLCKDCHVIDGKNVTITDVDIVFSKIKQRMRTVCALRVLRAPCAPRSVCSALRVLRAPCAPRSVCSACAPCCVFRVLRLWVDAEGFTRPVLSGYAAVSCLRSEEPRAGQGACGPAGGSLGVRD